MLPRTLVSVDQTLQRLMEFRRLDPRVGFLEEVAERHYDRLFATCLDVIESLLRESGDISYDSKLKLLSQPGQQVARFDLLLAEVGPAGDEEFRRLVVVEDKLSTNPESRRDVLVQILDYLRVLQTTLTPDDLPDSVTDWAEEYRDEIHRSMRAGDCLLVICGDEIHDSLIGLLRSYVNRLDASNLSDLVLIALPVYSNGETHLLVPYVVGGTERAARDLTLRVEVRTTGGQPLSIERIHSEPTAVETLRPRQREKLVDPEVFMNEWEKRCGREAADAWRALVAAIQTAGVPALQVGNYAGGAPYVYLENTPIGTVQILRLPDRSPEVRDRLSGPVWDTSPDLRGVRERFRKAILQQVPGAAIRGTAGRVYAPLSGLVGRIDSVTASLSVFATELATVSSSQI